jgi:hypothetical protein
MSQATRSHQPHDRLTRITERVISTIEADPEYREGDHAIVFMDDGNRGGIGMHGYESDTEAMADLLLHLKAIFEANGKTLTLVPFERGGGQG